MFKKAIIYFFISSLLIIFLVSLFNYKVDSLEMFNQKSSVLSTAVKEILSGNSVAGLTNFDERLFNGLIIENLKKEPDFIVLGSSRSMVIDHNHLDLKFDNFTYMNHSMSGAVLSDLLMILEKYQNKLDLPKNIIINIDPWIFNRINGESELRNLVKDNKSSKSNFKFTKYLNLINYEYTLENFKFFFINDNAVKKIEVVTSISKNKYVLDKHLTRYPPYMDKDKLDIILKREKVQISNDQFYELQGFYKLNNIEIFEDLIDYLLSKKIKLYFVMLPYNPDIYSELLAHDTFRIIEEVERYIKKLAKRKEVLLFGTYNPSAYELTKYDFTDGIHPLPFVSKKIFEKVSIND